MRVSLTSSGPSASVNGFGPPSIRVAQDGVFKHLIKGVFPFFCSASAGMLYGLTVSITLLKRRPGLAVLSDDVLASVQTIRCLEAPFPLASGAASELMKYSVPRRFVAYCESGLVAGQTVKPGLPGKPAPGLPTRPIVS